MKHIVIVDDSKDMLEGLAAMLGDLAKVTQFENPELALTFVNQEKPDLVVTDCDMPEISGLQLCKGGNMNILRKEVLDKFEKLLYKKKIEVLFSAIEVMGQYNGRTRTDCIAIAMANYLNLNVTCQQLYEQ